MKNFLFHPLHEFSVAGRVDTFISKGNLKKLIVILSLGTTGNLPFKAKKMLRGVGGGGARLQLHDHIIPSIVSFKRTLESPLIVWAKRNFLTWCIHTSQKASLLSETIIYEILRFIISTFTNLIHSLRASSKI